MEVVPTPLSPEEIKRRLRMDVRHEVHQHYVWQMVPTKQVLLERTLRGTSSYMGIMKWFAVTSEELGAAKPRGWIPKANIILGKDVALSTFGITVAAEDPDAPAA